MRLCCHYPNATKVCIKLKYIDVSLKIHPTYVESCMMYAKS